MLAGALLFLIAYAVPILQPDLPQWLERTCWYTTIAVWLLFAVDLAVRTSLADDRSRFLRRNWLDVPTLAVPMLRPLRALRVVVALNVLGRRGKPFARGRVVAYVVVAVLLVGFVASLALLEAERRNLHSNVKTFADALWWAATTVTTVGYGDRFPTTGEGRLIGAGLMVTGIALVGVVTASLASWFVEKVAEVQAAEQRTSSDVALLAKEVRALRDEVQNLLAAPRPPGGDGLP